MRAWLSDMREGFRILVSRQFWRDFRDYWSSDAVSARMEDWVSRARENAGLDPDWDVERRRWRRRVERRKSERAASDSEPVPRPPGKADDA